MTRTERSEYTYIKKQLKDLGTNNTCMMSIRTNAGTEYKKALDELYRGYGFHPCDVMTDARRFDENERILYIQGVGPEHWEELYSEEERELFRRKLA